MPTVSVAPDPADVDTPVPSAGAEGETAPSGPVGERGAGLVEYALLVALIVLVCVAAVTLLGGTTAGKYSSMASLLN